MSEDVYSFQVGPYQGQAAEEPQKDKTRGKGIEPWTQNRRVLKAVA